jgi:hypothetical protein
VLSPSTATLAAACGIAAAISTGRGHTTPKPTTSTTLPAVTTTVPATTATTTPSTQASTTTTPATTVPPAPALSAAGSLLRPPNPALRGTEPTKIPASSDCHQLLTLPAGIAGIRACATATGPAGTITGTEEDYAHTQEWDIWRRSGNQAILALTYRGNVQGGPGFVFHTADPANDGDTKLLAIEHTPGVQPVAAIDIVEATGTVVAHITLGSNGVTGPAPGGGIETWSHDRFRHRHGHDHPL